MSKLIYVSAQPDVPYFHWQCEVYGHNFTENGINPQDIHMIFALTSPDNKPSREASILKKKGYQVYFYRDIREKKEYIPSIKPYLVSKWLKENPHFGKCFFLHDSDIIFREKPDYEKFSDDDVCYLGDTKSYISYDYLLDCSKRYSKNHNIGEFDMLQTMVDVLGIEIECLKKNVDNSGGGQYIIKNTNYKHWNKIYSDSIDLYESMINFHNSYPINNPVQIWTSEMWALLWNLWCLGKKTKIIDELSFSWATDEISVYEQRPILHMAGVLEKDKKNKFYKGEFININPVEKLINNIDYFDYVDSNSSTIKYVEVMKSLIKKEKSNYL